MEIVSQNGSNVLLPPEPIWGWYMGWPTHSSWENRMTVFSQAKLMRDNVEEVSLCPSNIAVHRLGSWV